MSEVRNFTGGSLNLLDGFAAWYYSTKYLMQNPNYFRPDGIWVFCGPQGSGKTLSAVRTSKTVQLGKLTSAINLTSNHVLIAEPPIASVSTSPPDVVRASGATCTTLWTLTHSARPRTSHDKFCNLT